MPDTAIIDVQKKQIPVISSAEVVEDKLIVTGVSGANSVVEIFRSSQAEQSALEYLTAVESDAEGAFTATIPIEKFGENPICLSATATYADRATSALSKVYCCEQGNTQVESISISIENIYPNPATDYIFIDVPDGLVYEIVSVEGKMVDSGVLQDGEIKILHLLQGTYILRIIRGKDVLVTRFVKRSVCE